MLKADRDMAASIDCAAWALSPASKWSAYGTPMTYYANDVPLYRQSEKQR